MRKNLWLRTDEYEEAVRSLEWAFFISQSLETDPYFWKWFLITLHNSAQGFMILALWQGNGLLTFRPNISKRWLEAYRSGEPYPIEKLDNFLNLYLKVKDSDFLSSAGAHCFTPGDTHDYSLRKLNSIRNEFIHFTPKGWSLELTGLPKICLDTLDLIEWLGWHSNAFMWRKRIHDVRAKRALNKLRKLIQNLYPAD